MSQSGALTASILDWAREQGVGFSTVVSLGPNTAVELPQVLDYLATDAQTQSILVYMEGIRHARRFVSALRAAAYAKPVVVMKSGRQPAGRSVALTHSAAIVGSDDVFDAVLRRAGVVRVRQFTQLFSAAQVPGLALPAGGRAAGHRHQRRRARACWPPTGPACSGLQVASVNDLGEETSGAAYVQRHAGGHRRPRHRRRAADPLAQGRRRPRGRGTRRGRGLLAARPSRCSAAGWARPRVRPCARAARRPSSMPVFRTPEGAVDAFHSIASFYRNQQLLQQTPPPLSHLADPDTEGARLLIEGVLAERRKVLTEMESKALLAAFHVPVTRTMLARSANEAMLIASQLGYPVALKIDSPDISHKSDVQGVALDVHNATQVRDRYQEMLEAVALAQPAARINGITVQPMANRGGRGKGREVYVGLTTDDPFGPVITFGAGGTMIELINDRAMELPPLNQFLARRLIERSRAAGMLGEWRGAPPADVQALEHLLLRVSEMVCALPQLREMDINPVIVDETRRRGGGRAHRHRRRRADPGQLRPPGHPALPGEPGTRMADEGRRPVHAAPDPARRRRDAAGLRARPVAGEPLFPLRQRDAGTAGAHAGALHADRLRPRDGAGGGASRNATPPRTAASPRPNAWWAWCATSPTPTARAASSRSSSPTTSRARAWARG